MDAFFAGLRQLITISEEEAAQFAAFCAPQSFAKKAILNQQGEVCNEVFFITKGLLRVMLVDLNGVEHTTHFALEHQFISNYTSFLEQSPSFYTMQALEPLEVIVIPRAAVEWGYANLQEGQKLGRLIAEYYFTYLDHRIHNLYSKTPKERYDIMGDLFPNIHNRVPQHMIASYIGITPVHLSRLKRADLAKA